MTRHDLEKLLGGYAAGTLTTDERRALFDGSAQQPVGAIAQALPEAGQLAQPEFLGDVVDLDDRCSHFRSHPQSGIRPA